MCGIAGIIASAEGAVRDGLQRMVCAQRHRGPDDEGVYVDSFGNRILGLGHRRLSILDLSPLGHQPMVHPQTGDVLIFNGEIYNFRALREELIRDGESFTSTGDTEVLLRGLTRYGEPFLRRLQGMYALAFLKKSEQHLLLVRDPLGIKPLYYSHTSGNLLFASELRALLQSGMVDRELDERGVSGLLAFGAVQQPSTLFRSIKMLLPGHLMRVIVGEGPSISVHPFWHFPDVDPRITEADAVARLRPMLRDAVHDHLESDVPVGVFLSSGIDSTVVAGLARECSPNVRTFTVGFDDHADFSESALAAETARYMGLEHTQITINADTAAASAGQWLQSLDQPSIDGLNVFVISKVVRDRGIAVALSGQGGDEIFGGYPSFVDVPFLRRTIRRIEWLPLGLRDRLARLLSAGRSLAYRQKLRNMLCSNGSIASLYLHRRRSMSDDQLANLGIDPEQVNAEHLLTPDLLELLRLVPDEVASVSRLETMLYQGNMLLRDGDANGMAHSLELRLPLLDQRVVDYVQQIPGKVRLPRLGKPKHLLRVACQDLLRDELLNQPKRGFTLPIRRWMLGPLRDLCESAIGYLVQRKALDRRGIHTVWTAFLREPESPIWTRAFALVVLGSYLQRVEQSASVGLG